MEESHTFRFVKGYRRAIMNQYQMNRLLVCFLRYLDVDSVDYSSKY